MNIVQQAADKISQERGQLNIWEKRYGMSSVCNISL